MTFIKPNKNSSVLNGVLVVLAIGLAAEVFGMVALYNLTVNVSHNIAAAKSELDAVGAQGTDLNNTIVAALGAGALAKLAAGGGLVAETKPQYFPVSEANSQKWPIASHY